MEVKEKSKKRELIKTIAIIFLAVMLVLTFFSNTIMNRSLPEVATGVVSSGTINAKIRGSGTVSANETYEVILNQTREVRSVCVKVGDTVSQGDLLFVLGDVESQELQEAQEQLQSLNIEYQKQLLTLSKEYATDDLSVQVLQEDLQKAIQQRDANVVTDAELSYAKGDLAAAKNELTQIGLVVEELNAMLSDNEEYQEAQEAVTKWTQEVSAAETAVETYEKQLDSGILLFEVLPLSALPFDSDVFASTVLIVFFFCILIGVSLSFLFSIRLGAPIKRLTRRLSLIAQGDFSGDPSIETNDEVGAIGRQINQMSGQIDSLMKSRIQDEKEKKDLEIKMLQAQINPHFLYNTLDSIKWIATVQKNTGIVQVVTALSSLLKNMAKGFNEKVTLRQELDFLENYIVIEKIRYIELFDVETQVDDDALYQAKIIKLTLQPIVENSIFSGIEPSGRFGLIRIHAWQEETSLCVSVEDNGIGIEPENIDKLLTDTSKITKSTMSGIGLPNVDRRLKLVYGEEYGLSIESEPGQYTRVTIRLPLEV